MKPRNPINPTVVGDDEGWKMSLIEWQRMWRRGQWFLGFVCVIYSLMQWQQGGGEADLTHDPRRSDPTRDPRLATSTDGHPRPTTTHSHAELKPPTHGPTPIWSHPLLSYSGFFFFLSLFLLWWEGVNCKGCAIILVL